MEASRWAKYGGCPGFCARRLSPRAARLGLDRNLHLSGGPTALESSAAFTGIIVGCHVQPVFAGLAEGNRGRRLAAERGRDAFALRLLHFWTIRREHHVPR